MKSSIPRLLAISAAVLTLAACQTTDRVHTDLAAASQVVARASTDPQVARHGAVELQRAQQTLRQAEAAWVNSRDDEQARHLAYLAQQRARTALAVGEQARAEEMLQQAGAERERIRLEARTREAELATRRAQTAQSTAQSAQASAQTAREQADQARQRAEQESQRAAALERDLQALQSRSTERGMVVTLGDVLFATGRAELSPGARRSVDQLADVLKRYPERRVLIEGFTDSVGSESSNLALSQRRADAFRMALLARGVAGDRMEVRAHGEAYPVADNGSPAGRQQNRRVEVLFSDGQGRFIER